MRSRFVSASAAWLLATALSWLAIVGPPCSSFQNVASRTGVGRDDSADEPPSAADQSCQGAIHSASPAGADPLIKETEVQEASPAHTKLVRLVLLRPRPTLRHFERTRQAELLWLQTATSSLPALHIRLQI